MGTMSICALSTNDICVITSICIKIVFRFHLLFLKYLVEIPYPRVKNENKFGDIILNLHT